jgi:hypothetical protein
MVAMETSQQIVEKFLRFPINSADGIFAEFEKLPGAISGKGEKPLERYVCIPGTVKKPIVLVAHCDTVWDEAYGRPAETSVVFQDGKFQGTNPACGIGADDRAGCAMLWALRDCGHTLLLVNGEEKGKVGARFLQKSNPSLFRKLNRHQFMIELDWQGTGGCLFNQVDNTEKFRTYVMQKLGYRDDAHKGGCDLEVLCRKICGVNIGVGYHDYHKPGEYLDLDEWENTLSHLKRILAMEHPKFPTMLTKRIRHFIGTAKRKVLGK